MQVADNPSSSPINIFTRQMNGETYQPCDIDLGFSVNHFNAGYNQLVKKAHLLIQCLRTTVFDILKLFKIMHFTFINTFWLLIFIVIFTV